MVVALVGAAALAFAQNANAVIFTVNSADDADDGVCNLAHCSLREPIVCSPAGPARTVQSGPDDEGEAVHSIGRIAASPL